MSARRVPLDEHYTISQVAALLGVPVPTIRSWERRYSIVSPPRTTGRHRRYTWTEIDRLRSLRDAVVRGRSAADAARELTEGPPADERCRRTIDAFVRAAIDFDAPAMRSALDEAADVGVETAVVQTLIPAMRRVGDAWAAGTCGVGQEHLASEVSRTWLAHLASLAPAPWRRGRILLACGPDDLHTIGLESFGVLLTYRGWSCAILGARTPVSGLVEAVRSTTPSAVVLAAHQAITRRAAIEALRAVTRVDGGFVGYGGGAFAARSARRSVPGTYLGEDLVAAASAVEEALQTSA